MVKTSIVHTMCVRWCITHKILVDKWVTVRPMKEKKKISWEGEGLGVQTPRVGEAFRSKNSHHTTNETNE